jgi:hypothetical protein
MDAERDKLLAASKTVPLSAWRALNNPRRRPNRAFARVEIELVADTEGAFRLIAQRDVEHLHRFALQLRYVNSAAIDYPLIRIAGRSSAHTNKLEGETLRHPFRVNLITERYQASDWPDDDYARPASNLVFDYHSALDELGRLANVQWPASQPRLL